MKWLAVLLSCAVLSNAAVAREITPAEQRDASFNANIPTCDDPFVLQSVASRFERKESRFWASPLKIVSFQQVAQVAWRPDGLDFIPKRYCTGTVAISDGQLRRIDYSVREDLGIIGATWGTESCIDGYDRNYAYAPGCKQARP
jgi:hypothetical protein